MLVKDIMTKDVTYVLENDMVEKAANLLLMYNLTGLPVLDENDNLTGVISEGDLIRRASELDGPSYLEILGSIVYLESENQYLEKIKKTMGSKVKDIMTTNVITVYETEDINDAATLMVRKKVKRLPVLDTNGKMIGIISRRDIMKYLYD